MSEWQLAAATGQAVCVRWSPYRAMRVKICGVCNARDAEYVVASGADEIGVNFHPGSKRFVKMAVAAPWLYAIAGRIQRVGVTVDLSLDALKELWNSGVLDALQLHGSESIELCEELLGDGIPVIKAFALRDQKTLEQIAKYPASAAILIDAYAPGQHGGTGMLVDWVLAKQCVEAFPGRTIYLSGGLNPSNVSQAVRQIAPTVVDVASGVEVTAGIKDPVLVNEFVTQARVGSSTS